MATFTQDEYKTRSIDVVHINPSLREGEVNYTSIIGPNRAVRLDRYAPVLLSSPIITGPETIPGTLFCFPGVWDAAPTPQYTYQWLSDGNPIADQTEPSLETYSDLTDTEITCSVTATNTSGSEDSVSNGITVSIIEPIINHQFEQYAISGLNQSDRQNMMVFRGSVVSGIGNDTRLDMMGLTAFPITGMWRENRFDMMSHLTHALTGLGQENASSINGAESYVIEFSSFDKSITINNPSAANGITGWTKDPGFSGDMIAHTDLGNTDSNCFGPSLVTNSTTVYFQDVAIDSADYADVDSKDVAIKLNYYDANISYYDYAGMYYEALDDSGNLIDTFVVAGTDITPNYYDWNERTSGVQDLPVGTRTIRIYMVFSKEVFNTIGTRIDDISLDMYKYTVR